MKGKNYPTPAISDEMAKRRYSVAVRVNGGPWTDYPSASEFKRRTGINCYRARGHDAVRLTTGGGFAMVLGSKTDPFKFTDGDHQVEIVLTRIR